MAKSDATKKVTYQINVKELFGKNVPSETLKKRIGEEAIARIQTRTQTGVDKNGKRFKGYSSEYRKQKGQSNVDLVLEGQMQGAMFVKEIKGNTVTIGFKNAKARLKAENHIHGVTLPKRDFLGLPKKELDSIAEEFEDEVEDG